MKKIIFNFILTVFITYWICTLIYVSPKNYIKISLLEEEQVFNTFFFQKWGFFAPPPSYNDRLYFIFESKKDSTKTFSLEAIKNLQDRKSRKAPFNSSEDVLDYILSSTIHSITDGLYAVNQSIDYEEEVSDSTSSKLKKYDRIIRGKDYVQTTANFQTLKQYGVFLAKKNNVQNIEDFNLIIEIVQIDMPKFADRHKLGEKENITENLIFKSDKTPL